MDCRSWQQEDAAAMGFSPPAKFVIISLFIHMQAVVLDGNCLGCGHPS